MVTVYEIVPGSYAEKAGIKAGDILHTVNGHEIRDVLDYRFYMTDERLEMSLSREGVFFQVKIHKETYTDIGLEFETYLMDKKQSCRNRCIFCFIDQLPKGMRKTLYFKDDDSRLSFLMGNYITLTNLSDEDVDRIIKMHMSPVNISVHTTNPELRVSMMRNSRAGEVLGYLRRMADAGITLNCQIVLCRGINDGAELDRTMRELAAMYPAVGSVSVVPAGLTKFRDKLYPLSPYTEDEAREIVRQVTAFGEKCMEEHGSRIFFCGDELYLKAGIPLPDGEFYEDFAQIENGVGMLASMRDEFDSAERFAWENGENARETKRTVSVATGLAAYSFLKELAERVMNSVKGLKINVYPIKNEFFGENITVAGLLTGCDVAAQLAGRELGEQLLLPRVMLRSDGDLFLDGMTPEELSERLGGIQIAFTENDGGELFDRLLGIYED